MGCHAVGYGQSACGIDVGDTFFEFGFAGGLVDTLDIGDIE